MITSTPAQATPRRPDLDWIRVAAFALLVLYHVGMFYVTWDWHVKSPRASRTLEPLMLASNPWRLLLLFLVAGAAARHFSERASAGALARSRAHRLGLPIVLSMLVIVPPQTFYEVWHKLGRVPAGEFWIRYVTASGHWCPGGACIVTPTWNHMWFVVYLLAYSLLLALALRWRRDLGARLTRRLEAMPASAFVFLPMLAFAALRLTLAPLFPVTHGLFGDWYAHAMFGLAFVIGFGLAGAEGLRQRLVAWRWPALVLWLLAWAAYARFIWLHPAGTVPDEALRSAMGVAYGVQQWSATIAVLGFAALHLRRDSRLLRVLTEAVFPVYIVHQTIIVALAFHLAPLGWPVGLEAAALVVSAFGGGAIVYLMVRRVRWLRPWFGLKALPAGDALPSPTR